LDGRPEVIVIGAGPAGIAATIYLKRGGFDPLLFESEQPGGLLRCANLVENYPGFPGGIEGPQLVELFCRHLESVGGTVTKAAVNMLRPKGDGSFIASSSIGEFTARAVIIATGTKARRIELPGMTKLEGRTVFYHLIELLAQVKNGEDIVIYGGGDAAFDQGIDLRKRGHRVTVLSRSRPRCLPLLLERALAIDVRTIEGRSIKMVNEQGKELLLELDDSGTIRADRLLIACGRESRLEMLDPSILAGIGPVDRPVTNTPGLYLAGDVVSGEKRQVGIAVGSGISSAMAAEGYLRGGPSR
jgi:thioredoxin reductase (NADPH)